MSTEVARVQSQSLGRIEQVLINGDLSVLKPEERLSYYKGVCEALGLNPLTKPFDYITLNGKLTLYALKAATEQLRKIHNVSIKITDRQQIGDVYVVTAQARMPSGREDESTGAVPVVGLKGDALANAYLKAETKAKRRVTLSICGLGLLDETEVETIPAKERNPIVPDQPGAEDGDPNHNPGYRIPFGKFAKRSLEEVGPEKLRNYILYLEEASKKTGNPLSAMVQEFVDMASAYVAAFENSPMEPGAEG